MQALYGSPLPDAGNPLGILFDRSAVAANLSAFTGLDRKLQPLLEYRQFDYWVYEHHDNLIQLVAHLKDASARLDARNPSHQALFLDLAWLYLLSLIRLTEHLRGAFLGNPDRGLQEYLFGGAIRLRDKENIAAVLDTIKPAGAPTPSHLPPYYTNLRELVTRVLRRPSEMQTALQYAEAASALAAARQRTTLPDTFGSRYDPIAAKLLADVCGFLVAAGDMHPDFRLQARAYLLAEPIAKPAVKHSVHPTEASPAPATKTSETATSPDVSDASKTVGTTAPEGTEDEAASDPHEGEPVPATDAPRLPISGS